MAQPAEQDAGFGVYIHWPFCASKCPYCDFNSHVRAGGIDEARFLRAYLSELRHWAELAPGRAGQQHLLRRRHALAHVGQHRGRDPRCDRQAIGPSAADAEITLEANPSSVEAARFRGYRSAGVNRVSLGVQALDDADLRALGRLHTAEEALAAIDVAHATFERCSFDMIYARPGQTPQAWRAELAQALALAGRHLSLYQLTIEPETPFAALHARGKLRVPDGRHGARPLRGHTGADRGGGAAGLRDLQPRRAGRGVPPQPHLLALRRVRRHRPRRARPRGGGRDAPRHVDRAAAGALGAARRDGRPRPGGERGAQPRRAGRRGAADGPAAERRAGPRAAGRRQRHAARTARGETSSSVSA